MVKEIHVSDMYNGFKDTLESSFMATERTVPIYLNGHLRFKYHSVKLHYMQTYVYLYNYFLLCQL